MRASVSALPQAGLSLGATGLWQRTKTSVNFGGANLLSATDASSDVWWSAVRASSETLVLASIAA